MPFRPSYAAAAGLALALLCACAGCGGRQTGDGSIVVAVSIPPQAQFVERIGGEYVRPLVMVPPGASPHTYEPKPSQLAGVSEAVLYIKVGSGIEFELAWFDRLRSVNRDMLVVDASEGIAAAGRDTERRNEGTPAGGRVDPHIWVSPRNAIVMAENTFRGLAAVDPPRRAYYKANMDAYVRELRELDSMLTQALAGAERREFIVYHPAWEHLARDYGLVQISIETGGKEPTARGIERIVETAKQRGITVIFASPQFNTKAAAVVAREIGGSVVLIDPLDGDYTGTMRKVAKAFSGALQRRPPADEGLKP